MELVIDKNKIIKFYENYLPCDCDECKNFILTIKEKHPQLAKYFQEQGVDIQKPFELVSFQQDKIIEYVDCQYLLFGVCSKDFECEIDGVKVCQTFSHPSTSNFEKPNFVLSFSVILENFLN